MMAVPADERDFRGPGCDARCHVEQVLRAGVFGRSDLLIHSADAHEAYGRSLGRRSASGACDEDVIRTGPLAIDLRSLAVRVDGADVQLSTNELRLLLALAARAGMVVSYPEVAVIIWGEAVLTTATASWRHALAVALARLRRRLRPAGPLLARVVGIGVRLDLIGPDEPIPMPAHPNSRLLGGRWAIHHDSCRRCGRSDRAHNGRGLCTRCHGKAEARVAPDLPEGR